jgi:hypothetical protein
MYNLTVDTLKVSDFLNENPEIFTNPEVLFHGTSAKNTGDINVNGIKTYDGYSTVTLNPNVAYSLYAKRDMSLGKDLDRTADEGCLLIVKPYLHVGPGMNAKVTLTGEGVLDGQPAEWIKGNLGFYKSNSYKANVEEKLIVPSTNIISCLPVDEDMDNLFVELAGVGLYEENSELADVTDRILKYLQSKKEYILSTVDPKTLSSQMWVAVRSSQIAEFLRRTALGKLLDSGFELRRMGNKVVKTELSDKKRMLSFQIPGRDKLSTLSLPSSDMVEKNINRVKDITGVPDSVGKYVTTTDAFLRGF